MDSKAMLIILDGYGIAEDPEVSAIDQADTPFINSLMETYPTSRLSASGEAVGLPEGQFGNSEVGHLNLGAGRIVWQELSRINHDIEEGKFYQNDVLKEAAQHARDTNNKVHLMGLFSDGGVHSHYEHLFALLKFMKQEEIDDVFVHGFTDGRDTSPTDGIDFIQHFEEKAEEIGKGELASIVGRYFAMDRDQRWDRTQKAYDLLVRGEGTSFDNATEALEHWYEDGTTDEFIEPSLIADSDRSRIESGDTVIFFNIRGDRARQITRAFMEEGFDKFPVEQEMDLHYVTFTSYDETFDNVHVAYPPAELPNTIGEVLSKEGAKQLRIAETEKYPHVTYFFNGGKEEPNEGEERILVPSPKVATYDLQPEMSAVEVSDRLVEHLEARTHDFVVLNFANPDMVGHTGDMEATIEAIETIDKQLKRVFEAGRDNGYKMLIIADHGNADKMRYEDGSPHTAHTMAYAPCLLIGEVGVHTIQDGKLADIAPTLLKLMGIEQPKEMTGRALYKSPPK